MDDNFLGRVDAPIDSTIWKILDQIMTETAKSVLTGRRLLNIEGPYGLGLKGVPLGDKKADSGLITSSFVPLSLIHKTFKLSKRDLAASEKEGMPINFEPVASAAIETATQEDLLIFNGASGLQGLLTADGASKTKLSAWDSIGKAIDDIISAVTMLDKAGFHGPYTLALAPNRYNLLFRRYPQGGTELEYLQALITDGIFKAPLLESGGVLMASGKHFSSIIIGQDMTIGYIGPVDETLEFSISESVTLLIRQPKSICTLK
jgi:uncharacterized linocin/CFP29 family protein